ncbi:undecaprenyl-phosphate galactose phosphotransferase WbaP [Roseimaritima multifibrata]|nr:undecaprenyl-phosphate galactose phosphotransferase WbaP [Roseimaritima multifibrata]
MRSTPIDSSMHPGNNPSESPVQSAPCAAGIPSSVVPAPHHLETPPARLNSPALSADTDDRGPMQQRYWAQVLRTAGPLMFADMLAVSIGFAIFYSLSDWFGSAPVNHGFLFWAIAVGLQWVCFVAAGLYPAAGTHPAVELRQLTLTWAAIGMVTVTFSLFHGQPDSPYPYLAAGTYFCAMLLSPTLRTFLRAWARRYDWWGYPTLLIGDGQLADQVDSIFASGGARGLRLLGRFDDTHRYWQEPNETRLEWLGNLEDVIRHAKQKGVYWLVIAMPDRTDAQSLAWIQFFRQRFRHVVLIHTRHELPCLWTRPLDCGGLSAVKVEERLMMPEQQFIKRVLDLAMVVVCSPFLIPLLATLAILVRISSGSPVLYQNTRIGRDGQPFGAWKFRTMVPDAEKILAQYLESNAEAAAEYEKNHKLKIDPRITFLGKFLRKTSLDELPQIWNVITGDMSIVGPRPIQTAEIVKYGDTYDHYLRVRPGITGMWQINGRNDTTYEERLMYDRFYVLNWSPWLDLYILARTIKSVLKCEGAY